MRLVTYSSAGQNRVGAFIDDDLYIVDLAAAYETVNGRQSAFFSSMMALIEAEDEGFAAAQALVNISPVEAVYEAASLSLKAPLPRPRQMRDFMAYEGHVRGAREVHFRKLAEKKDDPVAAMETYRARGQLEPPPVWFQQPVYFKCNRLNVIGTSENIVYPSATQELDYELEMAFITGRRGKNIAEADARKYIFGYTIYNDVSARDIQIREMRGQLGPAKGKDFDTGNILGPCIVTADEVPNPYELAMTARLNGKELSRGRSGDLYHSFERMIEHVSRDETIWAGEVFGAGTIGGGSGHEHDRLLRVGDTIELEIEKIGVLRNTVSVG
jgi:2-keto-4-pentenoate hydratase/2-oxohepta-3-ene-1,7-dioic acid hydratase in catechol pathway